jgi:hypothetical protein
VTSDYLPNQHDDSSLTLKRGMFVLVEETGGPGGQLKGKVNGTGPSGTFPPNVVEPTPLSTVFFSSFSFFLLLILFLL